MIRKHAKTRGSHELVKRLMLEAATTERVAGVLDKVDPDMAARIVSNLYEHYRRTRVASGLGRPVDPGSARSRAVEWFIANPGANRYDAAKALGIPAKQAANAAEDAVIAGRLVRVAAGCYAAPGVRAVPHSMGRGPGSDPKPERTAKRRRTK